MDRLLGYAWPKEEDRLALLRQVGFRELTRTTRGWVHRPGPAALYSPMRAAVRTRYGPPEVVRIAEVDKPAVGDGEVLVKVHATTVNRTDCGVRAAKPFLYRLFLGPVRPRLTVLGNEFAGEVEAVGAAVTRSRPATGCSGGGASSSAPRRVPGHARRRLAGHHPGEPDLRGVAPSTEARTTPCR